jgi:hypothetical protein
MDMLARLEDENGLLEHIIFSDKCTFHINGNVHTHNIHVWGTEKPHKCLEHIRASPKVNMFCALRSAKIYGYFFFCEETIIGFISICL